MLAGGSSFSLDFDPGRFGDPDEFLIGEPSAKLGF
jgi:hypothetical protein